MKTSHSTAPQHATQLADDLSLKFLQQWAAGNKPSATDYLVKLKTEAARNKFKEAVAMGMLLKQAL